MDKRKKTSQMQERAMKGWSDAMNYVSIGISGGRVDFGALSSYREGAPGKRWFGCHATCSAGGTGLHRKREDH